MLTKVAKFQQTYRNPQKSQANGKQNGVDSATERSAKIRQVCETHRI